LDSFIIAEIPGLIEGAHLGKGLGHEFLRHAMRTRVLIHLIDGDSESPVDDMLHINDELNRFDPELARKPQLIALNKIDLPAVDDRLQEIKAEFTGAGLKVHYISAATGQGVAALTADAMKMVKSSAFEKEKVSPHGKVFRPQPRDTGVWVSKDGDEFVIHASGLERIMAGDGVTPDELRWQLRYQLQRVGANKILEKTGIKPGDKVRCGEVTWEW